jgi:hypothetical protein
MARCVSFDDCLDFIYLVRSTALLIYVVVPNGLAGNMIFASGVSPVLDKDVSDKELATSDGKTQLDSSTPQVQIGVYVLRAAHLDHHSRRNNDISEVAKVCMHNAAVCESVGETGKMETWKLLAKAVKSRRYTSDTVFASWGGPTGGALGQSLVDNLLRYYESLGDVQMLSTIVCALRLPMQGSEHVWCLLGKESAKFDMYIRKYADLLYGWGLLTTRAEVNKHLVRVPKERKVEGDTACEALTRNENRAPGISLSYTCSRCSSKESLQGGNYCQSCRDYVFRCVICDNAVRGLFTLCDFCGHGGHVVHLKEWFSSNESCPTGCGCTCTFTATPGAIVTSAAIDLTGPPFRGELQNAAKDA